MRTGRAGSGQGLDTPDLFRSRLEEGMSGLWAGSSNEPKSISHLAVAHAHTDRTKKLWTRVLSGYAKRPSNKRQSCHAVGGEHYLEIDRTHLNQKL